MKKYVRGLTTLDRTWVTALLLIGLVGFATAGTITDTGILTINSNATIELTAQRVGINNQNPQNTFDVTGSGRYSSSVYVGGDTNTTGRACVGGICQTTTGMTSTAEIILSLDGVGNGLRLWDGDYDDYLTYTITSNTPEISVVGSSNLKIGMGANALVFDTAGNRVEPATDNEETLGRAAARFSDLQAVLINGADICMENGCWTESINSYNESDACWTYEKPTKEQTNVIALWQFRNDYALYQNNTKNPYKEDIFNEMIELISSDGRPDFSLGRKMTYCFNEIGRTQAAMELIMERLSITEEEIKTKQKQIEKKKTMITIKPKVGDNIITTTTSTTTTSTTTTTTTLKETKPQVTEG